MAEVKWIKIVTDIFDNRKVKQIESLPEADSILVIWFKLICLAGSINDGGRVYFLENVPYTDEMLATQFRRPLNTVRMALDTFRQFGMIEIIDDFLCLPSWEKYQSVDKLEKIREQNRLRKRRERARLAAPADASRDSHATVTPCHATDIDIDKEIDTDRDIESNKADKPPKPARHKYGQYSNVLLSDEDLKKLKSEFSDWEHRIERLSEYMASTGKSYKNHLATIRNWARRDTEKKPSIDTDYGDPLDFYK